MELTRRFEIQIPGSTLTVWSAYGDIVDTKALIEFIDTVGTYRVVTIQISGNVATFN